jgi:hypothetical protein
VADGAEGLGAGAAVVVRRVLGEHFAEVSFPEDQHPVGEFGADGQDEAFGEAVRPRAAGRDLHDVDARIGQHGVERCGELSGPVADEEPVAFDVWGAGTRPDSLTCGNRRFGMVLYGAKTVVEPCDLAASHLWLAPVLGRAVFLWSRDDGWSRHEPYD